MININKRIYGIPLALILLVGIASAAIIGAVIFADIEAWGTYQGNVPARGFTVEDGDLSDSVTFQQDDIDGNKYYISFPLYENQPQVDYLNVLRIVPDGTTTSLKFSNMQRTNNGIISAQIGFEQEGVTPVPYFNVTTVPTYTCLLVSGNINHYVHLRTATGNANNITEQIKFEISKCED